MFLRHSVDLLFRDSLTFKSRPRSRIMFVVAGWLWFVKIGELFAIVLTKIEMEVVQINEVYKKNRGLLF